MRNVLKGVALPMTLVLMLFIMSGCALIQNVGTTNLTEDEKARIGVDTALSGMDAGLLAGAIVAAIKPEFLPILKLQVAPSMSVANKITRDVIAIGEGGGQVTEAQVMASIQSRVFDVLSLIAIWEAKAKDLPRTTVGGTVLESPPPGTTVPDTLSSIPSWPQLRAKSVLLQAKIEAVMR
jgi:hypothetical protein